MSSPSITEIREALAVNGHKIGYIYFASTKAIPGMAKVGMTTRRVQERMKEISTHAGCPLPFAAEYVFEVEDPRKVESEIHKSLADLRVSKGREFFYGTAGQLMVRACGIIADATGRLDYLEDHMSGTMEAFGE